MNSLRTRFMLIISILLLLPSLSYASAEGPYTAIEITSNKTMVSPGDTVTLAIINTIAPKWHIYWKNPGDSGTELTISWKGIDGLQTDKIQWPTPKKIHYEGLTNYGFEDQVILLKDITFPDTLPDGPFTITAEINLLVCADVCIPEDHVVDIHFNHGAFGNPEIIESAKLFMPKLVSWPAQFQANDTTIFITIETSDGDMVNPMSDIKLFSKTKGFIAHSADVMINTKEDRLLMSVAQGDLKTSNFKEATLLITYKDGKGQQQAAEFTASYSDEAVEMHQFSLKQKTNTETVSLAIALLFAFLGGVVLNLMPCVFPILSLKVLSLVNIHDEDEHHIKQHGLAYTAGIIVSFIIIAGLLLALRAAGQTIGWGFQLQNPLVILALAYMIILIGLNLIGFYEITNRFAGIGGSLTERNGVTGSFATGVLATLVATPCTAPFMGVAIGYAVLQPAIVAMSVFIALALGLAFPYLLVCFVPATRRIMPRPGLWMQTFKEFLAFPMFATAIWLLWVFAIQTDLFTLITAISGFLALVFGMWVYQKSKTNAPLKGLAILVIITSLLPIYMVSKHNYAETTPNDSKLSHIAFTPEALAQALESNQPVFVNMTAAWCITCKVNENVAIATDTTQMLFKNNKVQYIVGDWTNYDADITNYLAQYNRNGVPLYVFYGRTNEQGVRPEPVILPQILTVGIIEDAIVP